MIRLPRPSVRSFTRALLGAASVVLGGCAGTQPFVANPPLMPSLKAALQPNANANADTGRAAASTSATAATAANAAPLKEDALLPLPAGRAERRFSVVLNNATPEVLFMALLAETPLSVAVDPSVKGPLSISLKDVTLREALDLLRELHGLEYKVIGRHILVSAAQMQTRIFTVDYPSFNRNGRSELRVLSGSITGNAAQSAPGTAQGNPYNSAGATGGGSTASNASQESSRISTAQRNDLWGEIETSVKLIIGDKEGRSVVVSPQTGNIVVRALPREIRAINDYLEATRLSVQRQVMLEAKVVEVQLRDSERTGINWAAFKAGLNTRGVVGAVAPGGSLSTTGSIGDGLITVNPGVAIDAAATAAGSLLGLAFQTRNFAAVLDFLGTQGNTQVLSSPRIATMNNQKAVLKVGTDDFFVTSISSTTTAVGNTTATTPNIGVQPFFSGISLDVTPNIDANGYITLHVHPSVSTVSERTKVINLGTQGSYALPLASSEINESDAVVRAHDGNIIAIGGLMRQASVNSDSGVPGTEGTGIFRKLLGGQTNRLSEKRELVILLKPTIVDPSAEDNDLRRDALQRLLDWTETQPSIKPMKLEVPRAEATPAPAPATPAAAASVIRPVAVAPALAAVVQAPVLSFAAMGNNGNNGNSGNNNATAAVATVPGTLNWASMALAFGGQAAAGPSLNPTATTTTTTATTATTATANVKPATVVSNFQPRIAQTAVVVAMPVATTAASGKPTSTSTSTPSKTAPTRAGAQVAVTLQPQAAPPNLPAKLMSGSPAGLPAGPAPQPPGLHWIDTPKAESNWFKPVSELRQPAPRRPGYSVATAAARFSAKAWPPGSGYDPPKHQGAPPRWL
jgi:MSHA biogenesis protein MshL